MKLNITIYTWIIPTLITVVTLMIAFTKEKYTGSYGDGLDTLFYILVASAISVVSWFLYAMYLIAIH